MNQGSTSQMMNIDATVATEISCRIEKSSRRNWLELMSTAITVPKSTGQPMARQYPGQGKSFDRAGLPSRSSSVWRRSGMLKIQARALYSKNLTGSFFRVLSEVARLMRRMRTSAPGASRPHIARRVR